VCSSATFEPGQVIFRDGDASNQLHVVLQGEVAISVPGSAATVGVVRSGECLGEMSLLAAGSHSASATALTSVETAVLEHRDLTELIRLRPDIGLHIYRNLALGLGAKLKRRDVSAADR
jgi:CRP-like cAMP-binding protein